MRERLPRPRTWFRPHDAGVPGGTPAGAIDPLLLLGLVTVLVAVPGTLLVGWGSAAVVRHPRLRWWYPLALAALGLALIVPVGWRSAWAAHRDVAADAVAHLVRADLAGAAGAHLHAGSVAFTLLGGGVLGAALAGAGRLRRPVWLPEAGPPRHRVRRRFRAHRQLLAAQPAHPDDGVTFGVDTDTGDLVSVTEAQLALHTLIVGASGTGKTASGIGRLVDAVARKGRPVVVIDLKGDQQEDLARLDAIARAAGRRLVWWSLDGPTRYDPVAHGNPTVLTDKLMGMEVWSEPHYRRAAQRHCQLAATVALAEVLDEDGDAHAASRPTFAGLVALLDPAELGRATSRLADRALAAHVTSYLETLVGDQARTVGGLATRLATITESTAGRWFRPDPDHPEDNLDLAEAIDQGWITVFSLCSPAYGELAGQVGAMILQDLKVIAGQRLADGAQGPAYVVIDEVSALRGGDLLALLARGRAARMPVVIATQELTDLSAVGPQMVAQALTNTGLKLVFRQSTAPTAEALAGAIGTTSRWAQSIRVDYRSATPAHPPIGTHSGVGALREVEGFIVHPNAIKGLPPYQALLLCQPSPTQPTQRVQRVAMALPAPAAPAETADGPDAAPGRWETTRLDAAGGWRPQPQPVSSPWPGDGAEDGML